MNQKPNAAGIYCVKFLVNGEDYEVVVDDYFPCDPRYGKYKGLNYVNKTPRPAFSTCNQDGKLWVMILEKAWAKLHGSYSFIVSGHSSEVYVKLCQGPC